MWRCEWIWQTYCWVMMTSFALGLVTTILWCSWWCSSSCFLKYDSNWPTMYSFICSALVDT